MSRIFSKEAMRSIGVITRSWTDSGQTMKFLEARATKSLSDSTNLGRISLPRWLPYCSVLSNNDYQYDNSFCVTKNGQYMAKKVVKISYMKF